MTERTIKCNSKEEFHNELKRSLAEFTNDVVDAEPLGILAIVDYGETTQVLRVGSERALLSIDRELERPNIVRINVAWYVLVFALGLLLGVWL
jgi:hypothetical protein